MNYDVFISYSSADGEVVSNIYDYLTGELVGLKCWRDNRNIRMGGDYTGEIPEGIDQASIFFLVLTESSQVSEWVRKEVSYAMSNSKTVIPLMVSKFDLNPDMRFLLGNVQILDISRDMEQGLNTLEEVLKQRLEQMPDSPWYLKNMREMEERENRLSRREKEQQRIAGEALRRKNRSRKRKERSAMAKALKSSVVKTARKATKQLNQGLDVTTEKGAAEKLKRIRNRAIAISAAVLALFILFSVVNRKIHTIPLEDYVTVTFEGFDGEGSASVEFDREAFNNKYTRRIKAAKERSVEAADLIEGLNLTLSETSGLSNGDRVNLDIEADRLSFQNEYGYRLKYRDRKIKVTGLSEYMSKLSQLTEENRDEIRKQAEDAYSSYVLSAYGENLEAGEMEYVGDILLTEKEGLDSDVKNRLLMVFHSEAVGRSEELSSPASFESWWYLGYRNVVLKEDGTPEFILTEYDTAPDQAEYAVDGISFGTFRGYSELPLLIQDSAEKYREHYNIETDLKG